MTPANQKKFMYLSTRLKEAAEDNDDASTSLYIILDAIHKLTAMAMDFHFRPDINSKEI